MRRSLLARPAVWTALAIVVAAGVFAAVAARGPSVTTVVASRTDLEQRLIASGRVLVATRIQLSAQTSGRVVAVRAGEGQRVRAGELIVQLDDAEATAAVSQARAAVDQAGGRLEQLREVGAVVANEVSRQAEANLAHEESELARVTTLVTAGAMTRADLDAARRNVELARAEKNTADARQTAATPTGADSRVAMGALVESRARLAAATALLAHTRVVATQDGVVLSRIIEPGDTVQPGIMLLEMAAEGDTLLVIEPDERNLAWIRVGQRGLASADAYSRETFAAEVSYIAPAVDPRRGSIEVRLLVPDAPAYLKPDMTVSVDLTVSAKKQVLAVPSDAVRGAGTEAPWVYLVQGGRLARRAVTLGIAGEGDTEIASGLEDGAEVVLSPTPAFTDGQRVRPTRWSR